MNDDTLMMKRIAYPVTSLGPGERIVIWVSGCSLDCKGCITPELQRSENGKAMSVAALLQKIIGLPGTFQGITLTGGEPFEQANALQTLLSLLRPLRPEWDVLVFSGYPLATLQQKGKSCRQLLHYVDILVAGPYSAKHAVTDVKAEVAHPLLASSNQQLHFLTDRGQALASACSQLPFNQANWGPSGNGQSQLIGIISASKREEIHRKLMGENH